MSVTWKGGWGVVSVTWKGGWGAVSVNVESAFSLEFSSLNNNKRRRICQAYKKKMEQNQSI